MTKTTLLCAVFLLLFFANNLLANDRIEELGLDLSLGYRIDQLDWNIAGNNNGTNPNVFSELTWGDLEILQLQLDGSAVTQDLLWLKTSTLFLAKFAYGEIFVGANQDSDYVGDNRTLEWSRSENQSDDGFTVDVSGAFGPQYNFLDGRILLTPLLGYSFHMQNLELTEGRQTVSDDTIHDSFIPQFDPNDDPAPLGPIPTLNSSYTAFWWGPWFGLNLQCLLMEKLKIELAAEYHIVEYYAEADWNLRTNLAHPVSFDHEAHGSGIVLSAKTAYELNQQWALLLSGNVQFWQTGDGIDTTYFANGTRGGTRLNEVNWESYALLTGLRYHF